MKDTHLIIALYRALDRYGSTARPRDDQERSERGRGGAWREERRRSPGWVSVSEIESSQSPNTYPRLTRRAIRLRCEALSSQDASPVRGVVKGSAGLRTWVLVVPPGQRDDVAASGPADAESGEIEEEAAPRGSGRTEGEADGEEPTEDAADDEEAGRPAVPVR